MKPPSPGYKSKTLATWTALIGGSLGLHRFYLHGFGDLLGWLHPWPTLIGLYGVQRMRELGQDDQLSWLLIPVLGLMLSMTMLRAILYGLMPDERWNAHYNPDGPAHQTGWGAVLGVVVGLMLGAGILMATIAFGMQHFFELQIEAARQISQ
ncbi:hypothetical protein [Caldimonas brevitalea]|uniref:Transmembrane protein n=1 Tax=Caldimonas brevitalea TaxID=413882 RepID=A0A0G3BM22_9BURK|nr:hypothetical protein [Caldimonas brevitalea]AKJ30447.1 transmembrane protein [Caldimonas brevitalea]